MLSPRVPSISVPWCLKMSWRLMNILTKVGYQECQKFGEIVQHNKCETRQRLWMLLLPLKWRRQRCHARLEKSHCIITLLPSSPFLPQKTYWNTSSGSTLKSRENLCFSLKGVTSFLFIRAVSVFSRHLRDSQGTLFLITSYVRALRKFSWESSRIDRLLLLI